MMLLSHFAVALAAAASSSVASTERDIPAFEISPGVFMPKVSLGTWTTGNGEPSDPSIGVPAWLAAGGAGLDCAWDYFNQAKVASAISTAGFARKDLFLTTKVPGIGSALQFMKTDLQQLNTSYADLTLLHMPGKHNAGQWAELEQALAQNLTRAIGISNFNSEQIEELMKTAKVKPAVNQCDMGIAHHDDATIEYCQKNGIVYEAWGAMKGCNFTSPVISGIAAAHSVSIAQVCLRYVIDKGCGMAVGTGEDPAKAKAYSAEDLAIFNFSLTATDMAALNSL